MDKDLAQKAINYALNGNWKSAIEVNELILQDNPDDVDALNRIARANSELGFYLKARKNTNKVLKIDPYNPIALKNLNRWKGLNKSDVVKSKSTDADSFLEEPGKTKILPLINLGSNKERVKLDCGDELKFNFHGHRVSLITQDGKYIGRLPDDIGSRIKKLTQLGYEYLALVKCNEENELKIFIREVIKPDLPNTPTSFPTEKITYIPYANPDLINKTDFTVSTNEDGATTENPGLQVDI